MKPKEINELREELQVEFDRCMDRLPCYINVTTDEYTGAIECLDKFLLTAKSITQKHVLQSQNRIN